MARSTEQLEQSGRLPSRDPGGHVCPAIKTRFRDGPDGMVNQPCLPRVGSNACHVLSSGASCLCLVLLRGDRASTVGGRLVPPPRTQLPGLMQTSKTRFAAAGRGGSGSVIELPATVLVDTRASFLFHGGISVLRTLPELLLLLKLPAVGQGAQPEIHGCVLS